MLKPHARLLIALATLATASSAGAAIPATERQVLLDLFSSAHGSGWTQHAGWGGPAGTECAWYGVQCDAAGAHVTALNLDSNNLAGTLPAIAPLSALQYCILSNNRLTGSIPPVSSLTGLRILELYGNSLGGSIPSLAGLSSLTSLELNSNRLTGSIPSLASLTSLQVFDLDTNALTGPVPSLSAMTQLQYMALDTNRLSGPIPDLSALTQLSDCELYDNQFDGPVPSLANLSNLRILLLSNNRLTGPFPDVTGTALETLDLDYNYLSGPIPSTVGNATTLRNLLCAGNDLVGALPSALSGLTNLAPGGSDFRYNGLSTASSSLASFLDEKQEGGDWQSTQTIAPSAVSAGSRTNNAIRVAWTPIPYSSDPGSYDVYVAPSNVGPYAFAGSTSDKTLGFLTVSGLRPSTTYSFVVRTTTDRGPQNANAVTSVDSAIVSASTTSCGDCALAPSAIVLEGTPVTPARTSEPNGVLDPGETAAVVPSWTDVSSSTVGSVTGTLSGLSGPDNGTVVYSIPDSSATYGTLAAGATRSCATDGYQVRVDADLRPALHWDATANEKLSSGEVHTWTLHVGESFTDVPTSSTLYSYVETILHFAITKGTGPATYGPALDTMRDQMAAFIARAHAGGDPNVPDSGNVSGLGSYACVPGGHSLFADVAPTDLFCRHIHFIAARGLSFGCTDAARFTSNYCPGIAINRRSMAVMLARDLAGGDSLVPSSAPDPGNGRSYDCTDGQPNAFSDVPDSDAGCRFIYYLWSKGIVDGYGNGLYGPGDPVLRDQMAKYLTLTYGLRLYPID
ncbi:MAG TPA: S-layer homology domain-containing protein [Thermoanaerobaculia bacterium]|nr:S-layer homology domain-containing protein [Thermoanaerobaculia bacterium]